MPRSYSEVEIQLEKLTENLQNTGLWSDKQPSQEAMASVVPFAVDTMPLENWLQFIFIPNMRELIKNKLPLPSKLKILPIAELSFVHVANKQFLLTNIRNIDELFDGELDE
ncbi:YqcC family protein [Paraglaciecola aquimarina]|uniref:YqcC family protein n=1 Tax=Paraglaciecola algarum TaxID=3050085 RepID=A0ABS9D6H0_9ALTE|nr:YqcC family protein [Paraglaciecola sp. G1-23]MCF2948355.1 YqcC family protein [Paraglaciecola sp. G1-23]